jgi:LRR receptor-like serine/threonine-protein kinase FLS2
LEGIVSTKGDVYSFGIMLLESFTGKKPTEKMFDENVSLRQWVKAAYPIAVMEIIDTSLLPGDEKPTPQQEICICSIVELALDCSKETPNDRPNLKDVVVMLTKMKSRLLEVEK